MPRCWQRLPHMAAFAASPAFYNVQDQFQEIEHFKEMAKERYKIEARNSELKHRHGYDVASSSGLIGIEMQGAMAIFAVNLKRIIKLISEK